MLIFRSRISQSGLTWVLTALAALALSPGILWPLVAEAELRAFQLRITDIQNGTERFVVTRFDHVQYPMYHHVTRTEVVAIEKTWMCYDRSDFLGELCKAPAESPALSPQGGPGLTDRRPATAAPSNR